MAQPGRTTRIPRPTPPSVPPGYTGQVLTSVSLEPLRQAALEKIQGMDDPGKMPLIIGAVIVLAVVLSPMALRFKK